jgi:hypothetical protein
MGTTTARREGISDFIRTVKGQGHETLSIEGALLFNSSERKDQDAILEVYAIKAAQCELRAPPGEKAQGIEEVARLYRAQKCAFEDILTKEGFEVASEAARDYAGRIALLTRFGTVAIFGRPRNPARHITMSRIHSPRLNYDNTCGYFRKDVAIGKITDVAIFDGGGYTSSPLRGLAINPRGVDGDELEASQTTITRIGELTTRFLRFPERMTTRERSGCRTNGKR